MSGMHYCHLLVWSLAQNVYFILDMYYLIFFFFINFVFLKKEFKFENFYFQNLMFLYIFQISPTLQHIKINK